MCERERDAAYKLTKVSDVDLWSPMLDPCVVLIISGEFVKLLVWWLQDALLLINTWGAIFVGSE